MIEKDINGKKVVMYDSIDELPILRYHKFNKYIMIDSGIGENMSDVARHLDSMVQMNDRGDKESLATQIHIMRHTLSYAVSEISPKSMAFAVMVKSVNGKECTDISEFGLKKLIEMLSGHGITWGMIKATVEFLKKKLRKRLKSISRP